MGVRVIHGIDDLANDMRQIARQAPSDMARITRLNARRGNRIAKGYARESAGAHGKHYHKAFTVERTGTTIYEYGPDAAMPQGGMSFEGGSRNQPPHNDLAKSADLIGPMWARDVDKIVGRWFWP